jgi:predicted DNA-binding transcriptional regulator AlpA
MGRVADLDDLLDADQVASLLGLSSRGAVSVYRTRYEDFPQPVVRRASGRCQLWLRSDIEAWAAGRLRE